MFHDTDLRELAEFDGHGAPVLSLYLNVDPIQYTPEQYKLTLRSLLNSTADIDPADKERIEQYIELEYDRQGRGLACFSCQKRGFWRAYTFNVPVESEIMVEKRPLLRRLVDLLDTYGNMGVVSVDSLGARFFTFHLGTLEETSGILGEDVKRHKQGGWSASRYQRHEEEAAMGNLRVVAELTEEYARQYHWRRLVLAGTESNIARFSEMLSPSVRKLVVGSTPLEFTATTQEVRERAETVALNARQSYIQKLAEELIVTAAKGGNATLGLADTLEALQSGRMYQLLFTESYTISADEVRRCLACNYIASRGEEQCPLCGATTEPLPDAVNTIARRAITQGAEVIVLPEDNPLAAQGHHIGAYLRY